jgi:hypothetical protein
MSPWGVTQGWVFPKGLGLPKGAGALCSLRAVISTQAAVWWLMLVIILAWSEGPCSTLAVLVSLTLCFYWSYYPLGAHYGVSLSIQL